MPARVLCIVLILMALGCGKGDGLSDYERMKKKQGNAAAALESLGAKIAPLHYPQGDAWSVTMPGLPVTDDVFDHLKKLGRITELDLSKTAVSDAHMSRINEVEIGSLLRKLNLSYTAVTDAGLEKLDKLLLLGELNLTGSKVTATGVNRFLQKRLEDPKIPAMFKRPTIRR